MSWFARISSALGGALRLEVPQNVQIDFYDVIFKNNTAPSSADLWTDDLKLTTINLPLARN